MQPSLKVFKLKVRKFDQNAVETIAFDVVKLKTLRPKWACHSAPDVVKLKVVVTVNSLGVIVMSKNPKTLAQTSIIVGVPQVSRSH